MNNNDIILHKYNSADDVFETITRQIEDTLTDSTSKIPSSACIFDYALLKTADDWLVFDTKTNTNDDDWILIEDKDASNAKKRSQLGTIRPPKPSKVKLVSSAFSGLSSPYYSSIQTAIDGASSGDLIIVYPGSYNERLTLATGINLYFMDGATLQPTADSATAIIYGNNVNCSIFGYGVIQHTATAYTPKLLHLIGTSSVYARFKNVVGANTDGIITEDTTNLHLFLIHALSNIIEAKEDSVVRIYGGDANILKTRDDAILWADIRSFKKAIIDGGQMKVTFSETTETSDTTIYLTGGEAEFIEGYIPHNSSSNPAVEVNGNLGKIRLKHVHIVESNTSACIEITSGLAITDNCCLVTGGTYSITGSAGVTLKNWGTVANVDVNSNITQEIQTVLVDTNVE